MLVPWPTTPAIPATAAPTKKYGNVHSKQEGHSWNNGRRSTREITSDTSPVLSAKYTQAPNTIVTAREFKPSSTGIACEIQNAAAVQTVRQAALKRTCTGFGRCCVFQSD